MKQIKDFPDYYITKGGFIWSNKSNKWLKPTPKGKSTHLNVGFQKDSKQYTRLVHRLVLETFVGKCPKGKECRHLDGNPLNNNINNLMWDTHKNNMGDTKQHGTSNKGKHYCVGSNHPMVKLSEATVRIIIRKYQSGLFTQKNLVNFYSLSQSHISRIVNKQSWKHLWGNHNE